MPEPEALAYLLYTSGSTGRPKGVAVTHANLSASNAARLASYDHRPRRFLLLPSLAFDSSVAGLFWTLTSGGALVVPGDREARDPPALARRIRTEQVDALLCVPSLYAHLLDAEREDLASLTLVVVAGEACPSTLVAAHHERLPGVRLFNEYGPTEATVWASVSELGPADADGPVPIGRPIPGVAVRVLDARGRPTAPGVPGEAWIEGPTVGRGYCRRDDETRARFADADGARRYRTGDRCAWSLEGRLWFHGRFDEQLAVRGFRIEPGEVEAALTAHSGVREAAIVASGEGARAELVAYVVAEGGVDEDGLRRHLAARLPAYMIPGRVLALPDLPRLPNDKVDRDALRRRPPPARARATPAPRSALEEDLLALWRGLLGHDEVGLDDNFFELGGHSLLAVELATTLRRDFDADIQPADVFEHPTVTELARRVRARREPGARAYEHLFPIQPRGRGTPLLFCVPHFFSGPLAERFRGERPVYGLRGVSLRVEGNLGRWPSMEALAEHLVEEVQRRFGGAPCVLAGYSFGASMAVEVARLLERRGVEVRRLFLIAPMALDVLRLGPLRLQLDDLREPVGALDGKRLLRQVVRTWDPRTLKPLRRVWQRVGIGAWRHVLRALGRTRRARGLPLTPRILHADVRVDRFRLHALYAPTPITTPTVLFDPLQAGTDVAATWRPVLQGPLAVVPTPDPHDGDHAVDAAWEVILPHLERLDVPYAPDARSDRQEAAS